MTDESTSAARTVDGSRDALIASDPALSRLTLALQAALRDLDALLALVEGLSEAVPRTSHQPDDTVSFCLCYIERDRFVQHRVSIRSQTP